MLIRSITPRELTRYLLLRGDSLIRSRYSRVKNPAMTRSIHINPAQAPASRLLRVWVYWSSMK